jgi:hypothetical protein
MKNAIVRETLVMFEHVGCMSDLMLLCFCCLPSIIATVEKLWPPMFRLEDV